MPPDAAGVLPGSTRPEAYDAPVRWQSPTSPPTAPAIALEELDFGTPTALVFGNERFGVSAEMQRAVDVRFSVGMRGLSESLDVSVAAACAIHWGRIAREAALARSGRARGGDLGPDEVAELREDYRDKGNPLQRTMRVAPSSRDRPRAAREVMAELELAAPSSDGGAGGGDRAATLAWRADLERAEVQLATSVARRAARPNRPRSAGTGLSRPPDLASRYHPQALSSAITSCAATLTHPHPSPPPRSARFLLAPRWLLAQIRLRV
jgi:hypothetical protein